MSDDAMKSAEAGPPVLDRPTLMANVEDDTDLLATLVEIFREDATGLLDALDAAVRAADSVALSEAVHTLKGSVLLFGGRRAASLAMTLEACARDGASADAAALVASLRDAVVELQAALDAEVAAMTGSP